MLWLEYGNGSTAWWGEFSFYFRCSISNASQVKLCTYTHMFWGKWYSLFTYMCMPSQESSNNLHRYIWNGTLSIFNEKFWIVLETNDLQIFGFNWYSKLLVVTKNDFDNFSGCIILLTPWYIACIKISAEAHRPFSSVLIDIEFFDSMRNSLMALLKAVFAWMFEDLRSRCAIISLFLMCG